MRIPTQLLPLTDNSAAEQMLQRRLVDLSIRYGPAIIASNYSFTPTDEIDSLQVNATSHAITITLPEPSGIRRRRVIKTDASGNTVTLAAASPATINGASTVVLAAQYAYVTVEPTGTNWLIVS